MNHEWVIPRLQKDIFAFHGRRESNRFNRFYLEWLDDGFHALPFCRLEVSESASSDFRLGVRDESLRITPFISMTYVTATSSIRKELKLVEFSKLMARIGDQGKRPIDARRANC